MNVDTWCPADLLIIFSVSFCTQHQGDGNFSIAEVKAIITDLDRAKEQAKNYKIIAFVMTGVVLVFMAMMIGLMIFSIEVSKDMRPQEGGDMEDNDGNLVGTGTPTSDGRTWNNRATSLGGALGPDAKPVYALDQMDDEELSRIYSLTVDTSAAHDGSEKVVYRVSTIGIARPPPGASGQANPPTITVSTVSGDLITVTEGKATITDKDDNIKHTITGEAARRRRARRLMAEERRRLGSADEELLSEEPPIEVAKPEELPAFELDIAGPPGHTLIWNDVTKLEEKRRRQRRVMLETYGNEYVKKQDGRAFVRREESDTSFVFELEHAGMPTTFDKHHHGLKHGTILSLPVCHRQGKLHHFRLSEAETIPPELQAEFPTVRAYHGVEVDGHMSADITVSAAGVRSQIWCAIGSRCSCALPLPPLY